MASSQQYVYVMFSSTQYMIGRCIRIMTHHRYNHVSISLDDSLQTLYSFARRYEDTPFCGGFVVESPERYLRYNTAAAVQIFAIPVTEEQYRAVRTRIRGYLEQPNDYVYNYVGALSFLCGRLIPLDKCHTCVDFATEVIGMTGAGIQPDRFYSIRGLARSLARFKIYEGHFYAPRTLSDIPSSYLTKHSYRFRIVQSVDNVSTLAGRYLSSLRSNTNR